MRIMHTMLRVGDLDRSIAFYTNVIGMRLLSRREFPDGKFTIAFVGYDSMESAAALELTHNWDTDHYNLGDAFGHVAIGVDDVYKACEKIAHAGGKVVRPAGPMKNGTRVIAFVEDPDGYKVEVVEDSPED
jgi:lactoylglutathione lyase